MWKTFFDSGIGTGVVIFDEVPRFRGATLLYFAKLVRRARNVPDGG